MTMLRVQHQVKNFDAWKLAFDADPVDRKGGGVRSYRIMRGLADPNFVMIDLEFDGADSANQFLQRLHGLWEGPGKALMVDPRGFVVESVESATL